MDRLGIEHDGDFHNALDDALYTTKICRRLPLAQGIAEYPDPAAQLTAALLNNTDTETYDIQTYFDRLDHDAYKNDPALYQVGCPFCGKPLVLNDIWLKRGNTGYYTEATCPDHGPWFLRFKLNRRDGLHWNFARCIETVRPESYARYKKLGKIPARAHPHESGTRWKENPGINEKNLPASLCSLFVHGAGRFFE